MKEIPFRNLTTTNMYEPLLNHHDVLHKPQSRLQHSWCIFQEVVGAKHRNLEAQMKKSCML
jgi:hypothetical protein